MDSQNKIMPDEECKSFQCKKNSDWVQITVYLFFIFSFLAYFICAFLDVLIT
jgi:hypothetical protein